MKKNILIAWCLIPLGFLVFHFSLGERLLRAEEATRLQLQARNAERLGSYKKAVEIYLAAENAAHSSDLALRAQIRIDAARSIIKAGAPLEAAEQMDLLLKPATRHPLPKGLLSEARATLGMALYYAAYALRIETSSPSMWRGEVEEATRIFRDLYHAEMQTPGKKLAAYHARNLEATVLLGRTRRAELASLAVPPAARAALDQGVASKKEARPE